MPPEEPHGLVALWLERDGERLTFRGERVFPKHGQLKVSWYTGSTNSPPADYQAVLNGVVFAYGPSVAGITKIDHLHPTRVGDQWQWRDQAGLHGLMVVLVLPPQHTLDGWDPPLIEAKRFEDRVAVFWLLYPRSPSDSSVEPSWSITPSADTPDVQAESLNRAIRLARKREDPTDYDVALSYAGEDRAYVDAVALALRAAGVRVFSDTLEQVDLWGKNLYTHLSDVYSKKARFTVMFISHWYKKKQWPNFEREAAQARAFGESREYILPARFDDTELPGMLPTTAYVSAKDLKPEELARLVLKKLEASH